MYYGFITKNDQSVSGFEGLITLGDFEKVWNDLDHAINDQAKENYFALEGELSVMRKHFFRTHRVTIWYSSGTTTAHPSLSSEIKE